MKFSFWFSLVISAGLGIFRPVVCAVTDAPTLFNSSLRLKVFERGTGDLPDRLLGTTPTREHHVIQIPAHAFWYVRPLESLTKRSLDHLAKDVTRFHISGLDLSGHSELTDESLLPLQALTHVQMLDLSETDITDHGLSLLFPMTELTVLIAPESLSNRGLQELAIFTHLADLNLDRTQITDAGIPHLSALPALERLDISATAVTDAGIQELAKISSLRHIILNNNITDAGAGYLKSLTNLEEMDISQTQITDAGMKSIAKIAHLSTLYVGKNFGDAGARNIARSASLHTLDLTHSSITNQGVKELRRLKSLRELALSQTAIGNASLTFLSSLPDLRMLELSDTEVTSAGLVPLAASPHLEIISLSWKSLSRADLEGLSKLGHLRSIVLNGVPLSERIMRELRHLGGLHATGLRPVLLPALAPEAPPSVVPSASTGLVPNPVIKPGLAVKPHKTVLPSTDIIAVPLVAEPIDISNVNAAKPATPEIKHSRDSLGQPVWTAPLIFPDEIHDVSPNVAQGPVEKEEDHLLKTIVRESNPAKGGDFSSLAGLKQVRSGDNNGSLSDIVLDPKQGQIADQEDLPEKSLGNLNFSAKKHK